MEQLAFGKLIYLLTDSEKYQNLIDYVISSYGCRSSYQGLSQGGSTVHFCFIIDIIPKLGGFLVNPLSIDTFQFTTLGHFKFQVKI